MKDLNNKKVLLLCPLFYGYEKEIKNSIEEFGAEVTYINDHPSESFLTIMGIVSRLSKHSSFFIRMFENSIEKKISSKSFDVIIVINGPHITPRESEQLRNKHLNCGGKMILYYWDSLNNLKDDHKRWRFFDKVSTFDNIDYESHVDNMSFLPLFYCKKYWRTSDKPSLTDIMVVGSFRLNRYNYIKELEHNNPDLIIGSYLYNPRWQIWLHKTFRSKYNHVKYTDLRYKRLSFNEVAELYMDSKAIIDIPMPGQRGLTIRTIEALAMHKKIITSNSNITKYDFYDKSNIYIMPEGSSELPPKEWFESPFTIKDCIIKQYSLTEWLKHLLYQ